MSADHALIQAFFAGFGLGAILTTLLYFVILPVVVRTRAVRRHHGR